jgi:hypothetical protein
MDFHLQLDASALVALIVAGVACYAFAILLWGDDDDWDDE